MYCIYVDNTVIFDSMNPDKTLKVVNPVLTMEDSSSGSLEFSVPSINVGYNMIELMMSDIYVTRKTRFGLDSFHEEIIWMGRATNCDEDFYKNKKYYCEGALSFLIDTLVPTQNFEGTVQDFLSLVLSIHNSKVGQNRRIELGTVESNDAFISVKMNYDTTLNTILSTLVDKGKGHIEISIPGEDFDAHGLPKLNYYHGWKQNAGQSINFGKNLLDLTKNFNAADIVSAIIPRGKASADENGETTYVDISSVNNGSLVLVNEMLKNKYGYVEKIIEFEDIENPQELLEAAETYFSDGQFDDMSVEVSAFDLDYLSYIEPLNSASPFRVLDKVHCISEPHGMNRWFPITKIVTDLCDPTNNSITLNSSKKTYISSNIGNTTVNYNTVNNITNGNSTGSSTMLSQPASDSKLFLAGPLSNGGLNDPWCVLGWIRHQNSPYTNLHSKESQISVSYNFSTTESLNTIIATASLGSTIVIFANGWISNPIKLPDKLVVNSGVNLPIDLNSVTSVDIRIYGSAYKTYSSSVYADIGYIVVLTVRNGGGFIPFNLDGSYPFSGPNVYGPCFVPLHNIATLSTSASSLQTALNATSNDGKTAVVSFSPGNELLADFLVSEVSNPNNFGYKLWTVIGAQSSPSDPVTQIDKLSYAGGYRYGDGMLRYPIASGGIGITPWDVPYVGMSKKFSQVNSDYEWKFAVEESGLAGANELKDATGTFKGTLVKTTGVHASVLTALRTRAQEQVTISGKAMVVDRDGIYGYNSSNVTDEISYVTGRTDSVKRFNIKSEDALQLSAPYIAVTNTPDDITHVFKAVTGAVPIYTSDEKCTWFYFINGMLVYYENQVQPPFVFDGNRVPTI